MSTVFFPGTVCDERLWLPLWRQLNLNDYQYVPLQWANSLTEMLQLSQFALDPSPARLIGFSMGGYIAAKSALQHPDDVSELVLVSYDPCGLPEAERQHRKKLVSQLKKPSAKAITPERVSQLLGRDAPSEAAQTVNDMANDLGTSVLSLQLAATSERENLLSQLRQAPFKITLIGGSEDKLASPAQLQKHAEMLGCTYHQIKGCGHMLPLENPASLAACLR